MHGKESMGQLNDLSFCTARVKHRCLTMSSGYSFLTRRQKIRKSELHRVLLLPPHANNSRSRIFVASHATTSRAEAIRWQRWQRCPYRQNRLLHPVSAPLDLPPVSRRAASGRFASSWRSPARPPALKTRRGKICAKE